MEEKRGHQIIQGLLAKPNAKPQFGQVPQSDVLKKARAFLPEFIQNTDRILSDPNMCKDK